MDPEVRGPFACLRSGSDEGHDMGCSVSVINTNSINRPAPARCGSDELNLMEEERTTSPGMMKVVVDKSMLQESSPIIAAYVNEITSHLRRLPHTNARISPYQNGGPERYKLNDNELSWDYPLPQYNPQIYNAPILLRVPRFPWADNVDTSGMRFNCLDTACKHDRRSHEGVYLVSQTNLPLNPRGRCGLGGRGLLGRYGPNHAADPVATKWKRDSDGKIVHDADNNPILEFVAIKRKDTGDWAIPGGMVDPGENISVTLKREFGEETMASMDLSAEDHATLMKNLNSVFSAGIQIYSGYVDDIRNTDNAWMETVCVNFHDNDGTTLEKFQLAAGDDAGAVAWLSYSSEIKLYATHAKFLDCIYRMRLALAKNEQ